MELFINFLAWLAWGAGTISVLVMSVYFVRAYKYSDELRQSGVPYKRLSEGDKDIVADKFNITKPLIILIICIAFLVAKANL